MPTPKRFTFRQLAIFAGGVLATIAVLFIGLAATRSSSQVDVAQPAPTTTSTPAPLSTPAPTATVATVRPPSTPAPTALPTAEPTASNDPTASTEMSPALRELADLWLSVEPGRGHTDEVVAEVAALQGSPMDFPITDDGPILLQETITHTLTLEAAGRSTELITWEIGQVPAPLRCVMVEVHQVATWGCDGFEGDNNVQVPSDLEWVSLSGLSFHEVRAETAAVVITTSRQATIGTPVTSGTALALWNESLGDPATVEFVDSNGEILDAMWFDESGFQHDGAPPDAEQAGGPVDLASDDEQDKTAEPAPEVLELADVWLPVEAGRGNTTEVIAEVSALPIGPLDPPEDERRPKAMPETTTHILSIAWEGRQIQLITWELDQETPRRLCVMLLGTDRKSFRCSPLGDGNAVFRIANVTGRTFHDVHPEASIVVVTTASGATIGTEVVQGSALTLWDEVLGDPATVQFLDNAGQVVDAVWFDEDGTKHDGVAPAAEPDDPPADTAPDAEATDLPSDVDPSFPAGAPPGDFFLAIGPPLGDEPAAKLRFSERFAAMIASVAPRPNIRIAEDSGTHIGTAESERGRVELFLFDLQVGQGDPPIVTRGCLFVIADFGDDHGCGNRLSGQDSIENDVQRGSSNDWFHVEILNAQEGSAWLVIETEDGTRLVSPVVSNTGYMLWSRRHGLYARAILFDADLEELWSSPL